MSDWDVLDTEAERWAEMGKTIDLWWRDDDARADSDQLRLLLGRPVPIALAVIPGGLEDSLAETIHSHTGIAVLQHGVDHRNFSPAGSKKSEFPPGRDQSAVCQALIAGQLKLRHAFPENFCPVLVPPWNRFDPGFLPILRLAGYQGLSMYLARPDPFAIPGIVMVNTHVDVIDWRGNRGFIGIRAAIDLTVQHLSRKRQGMADRDEATGLLTHHLVHDTETWRFLDAFQSWVDRRPGIVWHSAPGLFHVHAHHQK